MAVYIIRPRDTLVERTLALTSARVDAESRAEQTEEVVRLRQEDEAYRRTRELVAEAAHLTAAIGESVVNELPITGTIVADMDDEEAERMREEVPDVLVLRDRPIELIPPTRVAATAKHDVEESDLWHLEAIGLAAARGNGFRGSGAGVTVAVLDTGIDPTHPELNGKVAEAVTFDARPEVWAVNPMRPSVDTEGHGTHVAGLLCGERVGVAPGARVLNGVMIPGGNGNVSDFILALEWASRRSEVQIVNMSAGIPGFVTGLLQVVTEDIRTVGILPVIATGNEGRNKTRSPGNYIDATSVGASNSKSKVASFSSSGTLVAEHHQYTVPDLVAPGEGVYSSVMGSGYEAWDGTSMATPIVSGVAALIIEKHPDITIREVEAEILDTCLDLGYPVSRQGAGLVQVEAAI